ncbi:DUF6169 family protein [Spirosoma sp. SC4-14]|uniref:DUF6169 family protein n=1 Tax=Spirosoma sp. SC4-14 TaxID=3128900 RepID=UPI0030D32107
MKNDLLTSGYEFVGGKHNSYNPSYFLRFFRSKEHVIIYICDSSDGRHEARFRKFTSWYYKNIAVDLFKMDAHLPDGDQFTILSGILSKKNPYFSQFVELFKHLAEADTEK